MLQYMPPMDNNAKSAFNVDPDLRMEKSKESNGPPLAARKGTTIVFVLVFFAADLSYIKSGSRV